MDTNETLLRAILATVARSTFPPADIYKIVAPAAGSDKQLTAYNLCDGKTPQGEIGKRAKLGKAASADQFPVGLKQESSCASARTSTRCMFIRSRGLF
jgi:hypothetical protein